MATVIDFVSAFLAGILAGMEMALHYGVRTPSLVLNERAQLQLRQALVLRLRVLVPAVFLPAALSGISAAVLDGGMPGAWARYAGLAALAVWVALRVIGTVAINSATLTWSLDAPPNNWGAQVEHAERLHAVGVWAAVIAFATFLAAAALRLQP